MNAKPAVRYGAKLAVVVDEPLDAVILRDELFRRAKALERSAAAQRKSRSRLARDNAALRTARARVLRRYAERLAYVAEEHAAEVARALAR